MTEPVSPSHLLKAEPVDSRDNPALFWRLDYRRKMAILQKALWLASVAFVPIAVIFAIAGIWPWWAITGVIPWFAAAWLFGSIWRAAFRNAFWKAFPVPGFDSGAGGRSDEPENEPEAGSDHGSASLDG